MFDRNCLCLCHTVNIHELGKNEFYLISLKKGFGSLACHRSVLG
jgi:hypothetical protein